MLISSFSHSFVEAGCDEAGRGCLAGPVFAAAVILPKTFNHPFILDSKQLTAGQRLIAAGLIKDHAISWAVASVDNIAIDEINILKASIRAMHLALDQLDPCPDLVLVDGNRFYPWKKVPFHCIIKGDTLYTSIAAASILAKTHRDAHMLQIHSSYPQYCWDKNKGYATPTHLKAISEHGLTPLHRQTFRSGFQTEIDWTD